MEILEQKMHCGKRIYGLKPNGEDTADECVGLGLMEIHVVSECEIGSVEKKNSWVEIQNALTLE